MRFAKRAVRLAPALPLLATLVACSSDPAPSKQAYVGPDASVPVPPVAPAPPPVLIVIKGNGYVGSSDGSLTCKAGGSVESCTPKHYGITLYPGGNLPWAFDHWEPSLSTEPSFELRSSSPSPLTAVFTRMAFVGDGGNVGIGD